MHCPGLLSQHADFILLVESYGAMSTALIPKRPVCERTHEQKVEIVLGRWSGE